MAEPLNLNDVGKLCRDLRRYRAWVYFLDFGLSAALGYYAAWRYFLVEDLTIQQFFWFMISGLALFRAGVFIHEIVHMPTRQMRAFKVNWNATYGVPMLMPSFMYKNHIDHHNARHYGTAQDGEYQPFAQGPLRRILFYFLQIPFLPILGLVRFLIIGPLSYLNPRWRLWVLRHFSSYVSNPTYVRNLPKKEKRTWWILCEIACALVLLGWAFAYLDDIISWTVFVEIYALSLFGITLNWIRNLAGHRFKSNGQPMSHLDQFHESITITGSPLLHELLFPVGMRFHALHHLLPSLPYHNLGVAHRRLMEKLSPQSSYHDSLYRSYGQVMKQLFRDIRSAGQS